MSAPMTGRSHVIVVDDDGTEYSSHVIVVDDDGTEYSWEEWQLKQLGVTIQRIEKKLDILLETKKNE